MLISERYREFNRAMHEADPSWGTGDPWFTDLVDNIARTTGMQTILNYGSGKNPMLNAYNYDPAIPGIDSDILEPADMVVSRCVLEHVEPECLDDVLDHMESVAKRAVILVVSCFPSTKLMPDGRNVHLIVQPIDWWLPKLMQRWKVNTASVRPQQRFWFFGTSK